MKQNLIGPEKFDIFSLFLTIATKHLSGRKTKHQTVSSPNFESSLIFPNLLRFFILSCSRKRILSQLFIFEFCECCKNIYFAEYPCVTMSLHFQVPDVVAKLLCAAVKTTLSVLQICYYMWVTVLHSIYHFEKKIND